MTSPVDKSLAPVAPPARAATTDDESTVALRVRFDSSQQHDTIVRVPRRFVEVKDGRVVGLQGPRVSIDTKHPIHIAATTARVSNYYKATDVVDAPSQILAATAGEHGDFTGPDIDVGQTTSFYAATQVLALLERIEGRRIAWGVDGQLSMLPRAWMRSNVLDLNAEYEIAERRVELGGLGSVRDGRAVPYTGSGMAGVDRAVERETQALQATVDPQRQSEARHRLDVLQRLLAASAEDNVAAAQQIIDIELATPVGQLYSQMSGQPVSPATVDIRQFRETGELDADAIAPPASPTAPSAAPPPDAPGDSGRVSIDSDERGVSAAFLFYQGLTDARKQVSLVRPLQNVLVDLSTDREAAAHEAAHAALAALKPAMLTTLAGTTFHEAYGDTLAFLTACDDDATIRAALAETGGDLTRSNVMSRLSENYAEAISKARRDGKTKGALRDAAKLVSIDAVGGASLLDATSGGEPHAVSQTVSGVFYAVFARRANAAVAQARHDGASEAEAVRSVRDDVTKLVQQTVLFLAENGGTLRDVAATAMHAARRMDGARPSGWADSVQEALQVRGYPVETLPRLPASARELPQVRVDPNAPAQTVLQTPEVAELLRTWDAVRPWFTGRAGDTFAVQDDFRTPGGERVLRFSVQHHDLPSVEQVAAFAPELADRMKGTDWLGAIIIDRSGRLVAASCAR